MDSQQPGLKDSALYRIAGDVGFNARVEPIWYTFARLAPRMGILERWRQKRRVRRLVAVLDAGLRAQGVDPGGWDRREGGCLCNLRVAKMGLVGEFKAYLRSAVDSDAVRGWPHVMALRDRACYMLPHDFKAPLTVSPWRGEEAMPVSSAPAALRELEEINPRLRVDETFALRRMVDFLDASERDIQAYESRYGADEGFWPRFAFVLIRKLAGVSAERGLPAILA